MNDASRSSFAMTQKSPPSPMGKSATSGLILGNDGYRESEDNDDLTAPR